MMWEWIADHIDVVIFFILAIILISIFWNMFDINRQEIVTAFENQIISVQDNEKAKLLKHTTIEYTDDSEELDENDAYFGKRHTIITTKDDMDILKLKVRYDESNEIVLLNYSCGTFWHKIGAIALGAIISFLLVLFGELLFL